MADWAQGVVLQVHQRVGAVRERRLRREHLVRGHALPGLALALARSLAQQLEAARPLVLHLGDGAPGRGRHRGQRVLLGGLLLLRDLQLGHGLDLGVRVLPLGGVLPHDGGGGEHGEGGAGAGPALAVLLPVVLLLLLELALDEGLLHDVLGQHSHLGRGRHPRLLGTCIIKLITTKSCICTIFILKLSLAAVPCSDVIKSFVRGARSSETCQGIGNGENFSTVITRQGDGLPGDMERCAGGGGGAELEGGNMSGDTRAGGGGAIACCRCIVTSFSTESSTSRCRC